MPHRFSVRVNGYQGNRPVETVLRYVTPSGAVRTIVAGGATRRVDLEPRWQAVFASFARAGADQLTLGVVLLMFAVCLAIPRRPLRATLSLFGTFAACWFVATTVSVWLLQSLDALRVAPLQILAAGVLAVAGIQNVTAPRATWVRLAAAMFGILSGLVLGGLYKTDAALAGSHPLIGFVAYLLPILVGLLWLLIVTHAAAAMLRRTQLPERWATVLLSALPVHAALHALMIWP